MKKLTSNGTFVLVATIILCLILVPPLYSQLSEFAYALVTLMCFLLIAALFAIKQLSA